jgi:hypothetical protein
MNRKLIEERNFVHGEWLDCVRSSIRGMKRPL